MLGSLLRCMYYAVVECFCLPLLHFDTHLHRVHHLHLLLAKHAAGHHADFCILGLLLDAVSHSIGPGRVVLLRGQAVEYGLAFHLMDQDGHLCGVDALHCVGQQDEVDACVHGLLSVALRCCSVCILTHYALIYKHCYICLHKFNLPTIPTILAVHAVQYCRQPNGACPVVALAFLREVVASCAVQNVFRNIAVNQFACNFALCHFAVTFVCTALLQCLYYN